MLPIPMFNSRTTTTTTTTLRGGVGVVFVL